jgi:hypothetical protein
MRNKKQKLKNEEGLTEPAPQPQLSEKERDDRFREECRVTERSAAAWGRENGGGEGEKMMAAVVFCSFTLLSSSFLCFHFFFYSFCLCFGDGYWWFVVVVMVGWMMIVVGWFVFDLCVSFYFDQFFSNFCLFLIWIPRFFD